MNRRMVFQAISFEWRDLLLKIGQALSAFLLKFHIAAVLPTVKQIGNVAFSILLAFVVERIAVMFHIVEPNPLRAAALRKKQHRSRNASVGAEDTAGHRNHA